MSSRMSEEEIYRRARKRVEDKKGFYIHLAIYILVNAGLALIWAFAHDGGRSFPWFVFPLGGWGIGLIFHFLSVFVLGEQTDWERREIEKEADKLRKSG